jgi:hypothetical protein
VRARKIDLNQNDIVDAFRKLGASVLVLSAVGQGCPDALVGMRSRHRRINVLVEIKGARGKLTPDQISFHSEWKGDARIIRTVEEAAQLVNEIRSLGALA